MAIFPASSRTTTVSTRMSDSSPVSAAPKSRRKRRSVMFSTTVVDSYGKSAAAAHKIHPATLWYTRKDCARFTDEFHKDIESMRKTAVKYGRKLDSILRACQDLKLDSGDAAIPSCLKHNGLTHIQFVGLERFAAHRIVQDKKYRRQEQWDAVCDVQDSTLSPHSQEVLLRQTCERVSRPSRLLSQVLAHAAVPPPISRRVEI